MASHFKWYPSDTEVTVPFNARYSFPSQANKAVKMTPRIPPKTGSTYTPGSIIRLEFPAQGYVNPNNTTLEFDVILHGATTPANSFTRFQNNIQSLFSRIRLLYGSTPIEDIINYNQIVRMLTEWTGTAQVGTLDQTSIADGVGGVVYGTEGYVTGGNASKPRLPIRTGFVNIRQAYIQGIDLSVNVDASAAVATEAVSYQQAMDLVARGNGFGYVPNRCLSNGTIDASGTSTIRRYQVSLALGLFNQEKLIPTKFMASQLAIEITLATAAECIIHSGSTTNDPSYTIRDVNLIPEILEFDASYDAMFLKGLQEGGVPIKFSSWHTYIFGTGGSSNINLQIQERSRSVKALFAVQRRAPYSIYFDSGACFASTTAETATDNGSTGSTLATVPTIQSYQFRIGGRYFPASPVQLSTSVGGSSCNGGAEAFMELQKALNTVGDMRLSTGINTLKWCTTPSKYALSVNGSNTTATYHPELDYCANVVKYEPQGYPVLGQVTYPDDDTGNCFSGNASSQCFAMAIDLETSNGVEISGLNAEEQSDISLLATYSSQQNVNFSLEVYAYYDAMIILRENNVIELIQ